MATVAVYRALKQSYHNFSAVPAWFSIILWGYKIVNGLAHYDSEPFTCGTKVLYICTGLQYEDFG